MVVFQNYPKRRTVIEASRKPRERDNKLFKDGSGFVFEAYINQNDNPQVKGPLCPKSLQPLPENSSRVYPAEVKCNNTVCQQAHRMDKNNQQYCEEAHQYYEALKRSQLEFDSWDVSKSEASDSQYKIKAFFTNLNNIPRVIIYVFKREEGGEKAQIFLDLKREHITYDPTDIPPGEIISKITIDFKSSTQIVNYK